MKRNPSGEIWEWKLNNVRGGDGGEYKNGGGVEVALGMGRSGWRVVVARGE